MSNDFIDRLAREMARSDTLPAWMPRAPQLSVHVGTLTAVDGGTNTAHFQFNDPSGLIVPGVRVMHTYSPAHLPVPGDVAYAHHNGTDLIIIGQLTIPTNTVTP